MHTISYYWILIFLPTAINDNDRYMTICPGLHGWAGTRRNIHSHLTWTSTISFLHLLPSIASSLYNLHAWQSFCTTSPSPFGLPLGLEPSTSYSIHFFTQSLSSFCNNTCSYHRNLFWRSTEITAHSENNNVDKKLLCILASSCCRRTSTASLSRWICVERTSLHLVSESSMSHGRVSDATNRTQLCAKFCSVSANLSNPRQ